MSQSVAAERRLSLVWMVLMALTFASFLVGIEQGEGLADAAAVILIGVAMFKVRLIGIYFMDLRMAPLALRLVFEGYVLAVFGILAIIDLVVVV